VTRLQITRLFSAPPERVWAAFTRPEALTAWFWPARLSPAVTADVRPGGRYRIEATGMAVSGEYREVTEPTRLVFTWRWDGEADESLVTIELAAHDGKTELQLTHEQLDDQNTADMHAQGWNDCLERLVDWV
jgi:uncharacterized protein YndB with AHSA1/START domain